VIDSPHPSRYGSTDLVDTILGLQVITNATVSKPIGPWTDVSGDGKIGMA
jgi:hypothetical protein